MSRAFDLTRVPLIEFHQLIDGIGGKIKIRTLLKTRVSRCRRCGLPVSGQPEPLGDEDLCHDCARLE
jgi:hypothetical protein